MSIQRLVFGSRTSALARWQTEWVIAQLRAAWPTLTCEVCTFTTTGDRALDTPLPQLGGKGIFTEELEAALRAQEIDVAVHSLKDLPVDDAPGLTLGAVSVREDAHDVLIARETWTLASLPRNARVGTCSVRRTAQILAVRPDLTILPVRGNVDTRVGKVVRGEYEAIVLAAAGVKRLGLTQHIAEYLPFEMVLPAPGQAALAVQCRAKDAATLEVLLAIDHAPTRAAVTAERNFLKALGGGCSAPVAAYAQIVQSQLEMTGLVASTDGQTMIRVTGRGPNVAEALAQHARQQGAEALLA